MLNSSQEDQNGLAQGPVQRPSGSSPVSSLEELASDLFGGLDLSPPGSEVLEASRPVFAVPPQPAHQPRPPSPEDLKAASSSTAPDFVDPDVYTDEEGP